MIVLLLAWRNLFRHKGKSILIGTILFFTAFLMTVGNAVISGMQNNMVQNVARHFTGDVVIISTNQDDPSIFINDSDEYVENITGYSNIKSALQQLPYVEKFLPMGLGKGAIIENESPFGLMLLGVNFEDYQKHFGNNVFFPEGRALKNGESGVILHLYRRRRFYKVFDRWITPLTGVLVQDPFQDGSTLSLKPEQIENSLVFMGMGKDTQSDVRLPVVGIAKYRDYNYFLNWFAFLDIDSFRKCMNYISSEDLSRKIPPESGKLLQADENNLETLFEKNDFLESGNKNRPEKNIRSLLIRKKTAGTNAAGDSGVYTLISVLLKKGVPEFAGVALLNQVFRKQGLDARAVPWQDTFGQVYDGTELFRSVVSGFIFFLYFVVIVVMTNTLNMAVIERSSEIAMMRSIGASVQFIGELFLAETHFLSLTFGTAGIIAGSIAVFLLNQLGITSGYSEVMSIFFASDTFSPRMGTGEFLVCFAELVLFTSIAVIYPIRLAVRVKLLEAIAKD